jgi:hypothetical protein
MPFIDNSDRSEHFLSMTTEATSLFRARVPAERLRKAEEIELREGLPFEVTTRPPAVLSPEQQATEWQEALGAY